MAATHASSWHTACDQTGNARHPEQLSMAQWFEVRVPLGRVIVAGTVAGALAGLTALLLMAMLAVLAGQSPLAPLQSLATLVTGASAGQLLAVQALIVGSLAALVLAIAWGIVFFVATTYAHASPVPGVLLVWGIVFGLTTWLVDAYLVAPLIEQLRGNGAGAFGQPSAAELALAHALGGGVLGLVLARWRDRLYDVERPS